MSEKPFSNLDDIYELPKAAGPWPGEWVVVPALPLQEVMRAAFQWAHLQQKELGEMAQEGNYDYGSADWLGHLETCMEEINEKVKHQKGIL